MISTSSKTDLAARREDVRLVAGVRRTSLLVKNESMG